MSEWQKDLSAVAFEAADLVQRVRTLYLATLVVSESAPAAMADSVGQARVKLHAALDLIEAGAEHLLQMDDEQSVTQLDDEQQLKALSATVDPSAEDWARATCAMLDVPYREGMLPGPRFSRPGGTPDPADGWPQ